MNYIGLDVLCSMWLAEDRVCGVACRATAALGILQAGKEAMRHIRDFCEFDSTIISLHWPLSDDGCSALDLQRVSRAGLSPSPLTLMGPTGNLLYYSI